MSTIIVSCAGPAGRNKAEETAHAVRSFLRFLLFLLFFLFSLRLFVTSLHFYRDFPSYAVVALAFFAVPATCFLWRPWPCLFWFLALVPLINGLGPFLRIFSPLPLVLGFAGIYCAWFYGVLRRGGVLDIRPNPAADILATVIFLSLLATLNAPSGQSLAWKLLLHNLDLYSPPVSGIWATQTILSGIFLLRLIDNNFHFEAKRHAPQIFRFHALTVIVFSLLQLASYKNGVLRVHWPFEDIHSYGSYVAFLFLYFLTSAISERWRLQPSLLSLFLGLLIVLSYSRITWVSVALCSIFVLFGKSWKKIVAAIVVVVCIIGFTLYQRPRIEASFEACQKRGNAWCVVAKPYVSRYFALSDVRLIWQDRSLLERVALYRKAIAMLLSSEGLGCGIGSFWRLTNVFKISSDPFGDFVENAHNYYLQVAAELGIPGLVAFLAVIWRFFSKKTKGDTCTTAIRFGGVGYLLTCMTGHPLLLSVQQFLFWFFVAAVSPVDVKNNFNGKITFAALCLFSIFYCYYVSRISVWIALNCLGLCP